MTITTQLLACMRGRHWRGTKPIIQQCTKDFVLPGVIRASDGCPLSSHTDHDRTMSNVPKTPPSKCRVGGQLDDPDITPTRHRRYDSFSPALTRRKSWEEEAVVSLADPRELESLAFIDIWRGDFAQSSNDAFKDFRATLRFEFQARPTDHQRMLQATKKDDRGW